MTRQTASIPESMMETIERLADIKSIIEHKESQFRDLEQHNAMLTAILKDTACSLQSALGRIQGADGALTGTVSERMAPAAADGGPDSEALRLEIAACQARIEELTRLNETMQASLSKMEDERVASEAAIQEAASCQARIEELTRLNETMQASFAKIEDEKQALVKGLERKERELLESKELMRKNDSAYKAKLDKLIAVYEQESAAGPGFVQDDEMRDRLEESQKHIEQLTAANRELSRQTEELTRELASLRQTADQKDKEKQQAAIEYRTALSGIKADYDKRVAALEAEITALKKRVPLEAGVNLLEKNTVRKPLVQARRSNVEGITELLKD